MKKTLLALTAAMLLLSTEACKKKEEHPQPPAQQAPHGGLPQGPVTGSPQAPAPGHGMPQVQKVDLKVVVPKEVEGRWSAVKFIVEDKSKNSKQELSAPVGGELKIPDSNLVVKVGPFMPDFKMNGDTITSASNDANNPAVGVVVYEGGKQIFPPDDKKIGWIYVKFPAIHPFQHDRFTLALKEGVKK
ncbi:MAG: hypothetical protein HZA16_07480 [Nitrospirae bacterium]|nr:hypothetical protein [Nitrospirota bacterium]